MEGGDCEGFLSLEMEGSWEPDLKEGAVLMLLPMDGRGPRREDAAAVVTGFDIAREAEAVVFLFSFFEVSAVTGFEVIPCSCLILNLRRLTRSLICSGLILSAIKYKGCRFFRYSMTSSVLVSAFNCLSFIL